MKTGLCHYSGFKVYPGHGIRFVRFDAKSFQFLNHKCLSAFNAKGNPRKCLWTAVYRRLHHKGADTTQQRKKKTRKVQITERAIVGASLDMLKQKREKKEEIAAAAKKAAIAAQKEKKQARAAKGGAKGGAKAAAKPSGEKKKEAAPAAAKKDAGKAKK